MSSLFTRRRPAGTPQDGLALGTPLAPTVSRSVDLLDSLSASSFAASHNLAAHFPHARSPPATPNNVRRTVSHLAKRLAFARPADRPRAPRSPSPPTPPSSAASAADIRRPSGLGRRATSFDGSLLTDSPRTPHFARFADLDSEAPRSPFSLDAAPPTPTRFPRAYPVEEEIMPARREPPPPPPPPKIKLTARSPIATGGFGFGITDADAESVGRGRVYGSSAAMSMSTPNILGGAFSRSRSPSPDSLAPSSALPAHGHTPSSSSLAPSSAPSFAPSTAHSLAPTAATGTSSDTRVFYAFPLPPPSPVVARATRVPASPSPSPSTPPDHRASLAPSLASPIPSLTRTRKRPHLTPPIPLSLLLAHTPLRDLPSLALVSRRFRSAAQAALYTSLSLPPDLEDADDDTLSHRTDTCIALLAASPALASLVRSFTLTLPPAHAAPRGTFDAALCIALRNMKHLRTLALPLVPAFLALCGGPLPVVRLRLTGARVPWQEIVACCAPALVRLELPHVAAAGMGIGTGEVRALGALREVVGGPEVVRCVARAAGALRRAEVLVESTIYEGLRPGELMRALAEGAGGGGEEEGEEEGKGVRELVLVFGRSVDGRTRGKVLAAIGRESALGARLEELEIQIDAGAMREKDAEEALHRQLASLLPHTPALRALRLPDLPSSNPPLAPSDVPLTPPHPDRPPSADTPHARPARLAQWARLAPALHLVDFAGTRWTPVVRHEREWVPVDV
ncbi:hypothetical protein K488DRAFT_87221 [Vararia minispora EC-137]|uniref:Uncharacterized protein n=1 Tax=Vararia minispora EC-137 TaxID=1314806 RepID=A0ACB8QGQ1_9AGAM|nr:hypothetical protein K488DRAFT_87221 [Vararia minispora EC-137]